MRIYDIKWYTGVVLFENPDFFSGDSQFVTLHTCNTGNHEANGIMREVKTFVQGVHMCDVKTTCMLPVLFIIKVKHIDILINMNFLLGF